MAKVVKGAKKEKALKQNQRQAPKKERKDTSKKIVRAKSFMEKHCK